MIGFTAALLAATVFASSPGSDNAIIAALKAHYDSLLAGRVASYRLDVKRLPQLSSEIQVTGVEDNACGIPRGVQLCWVDAVVVGAPKRLPVTVRIIPQELVPVADKDISLFATLTDSMVVWRLMATDYLGSAKLPTQEQIIHSRSRMKISRGTVITQSRLESIPDVRPGDQVVLASGGSDIEVRTLGKALEDARIGEFVSTMNIASGRRLRGVLEAGKIVRVQ